MQPQAATLSLAAFPKRSLLTDALLICSGTALVSLAAQISIPLGYTPVPITAQTFAVVLVGAALGSWRGFASLTLYMLIGIAGAPVYASHKDGWHVFTASTGGYIVGFVAAAALTGYLAERRWDRKFSTAVSAMLTGNVVIYLFGLPWLHHYLHISWSKTFEYGLYPFVPVDIVKLYLAALALPAAWRLVEHAKS
jgi:biotin transport system substrate-specific component